MRFPARPYLLRVEELTDLIEQGSSAEVVVTIASRSGSYRDVDHTWGAVMALVSLVVLVFSPLVVSHGGLLSNLLLSYGLGWFLARRIPALRRIFTSAARRRQQVCDAARLAYFDAALDATPTRVGVMLYLSLFERDLEIVADHGVVSAMGRAPQHEFEESIRQATDAERLDVMLSGLERYGAILQKLLPAGPETIHTIPNRPRLVEE